MLAGNPLLRAHFAILEARMTPHRTAIIGNSGSGKSTLATRLAQETGAALLDLDTVAWVPGEIAVAEDPEVARREVDAFCRAHERWVIEGCYASLVQVAERHGALLLFLDPGAAQCVANCRARPWEPHKYATQAEQDARLPFLLEWVEDYYRREGEMSHAAHRALFEAWTGPKQHLRELPGADFRIGAR